MNQNAISQALMRQIVAHVPCAVCGHHFKMNDIQIVGRREHVWALRIRCRMCHTQALVLAAINEGTAQTIYTDLDPDEWERFKDAPPISTDDVIAIHQYMDSYDGDFSEILEEPLPKE